MWLSFPWVECFSPACASQHSLPEPAFHRHWRTPLPSWTSGYQSIKSKFDLHYRAGQSRAHTGPEQIDFSGVIDVEGDTSWWLIIYPTDKSFCCLCHTWELEVLLPRVPAVIGGFFTLGIWTKPNKRRFLLASPFPDSSKEQWRQRLGAYEKSW